MASFKLNYQQIKNQLHHLIKDTSFPLRVQKLYGTEHFICAESRMPGKSVYLYFGRGSHYEGLFYWEDRPHSELRCKDQFLEYLRKNLRGQKILNIEIHPHDRLLRLELGGSLDALMGFFWKGPKLVFYHLYKDQNKWQVFHSSGEKEVHEYIEKDQLIELVEQKLGVRSESEHREAKPVLAYDDYEKFYRESYLKKSVDNRKLKRQKKKIENVENDLKKLQTLLSIEKYLEPEKEAELTSLGEIKLAGKKIIFGSINYYQKRGMIFDKLKNYRKNIQRQADLVKQMRESLSDEGHFKQSKSAKLIRVFEKARVSVAAKSDNVTQNNYKEFILDSGEKIYVGLSANGNDFIRNKIATKSDMWVHLENYTSPHAIVKNIKENRPSLELMQVVGSIIRDHSDHAITEIPLQYTEVKNLKGLKGKPGSVIFKKEKYITVSYHTNWRHNILKSF